MATSRSQINTLGYLSTRGLQPTLYVVTFRYSLLVEYSGEKLKAHVQAERGFEFLHLYRMMERKPIVQKITFDTRLY